MVLLIDKGRDYRRWRHSPKEEWYLAKNGFQSVSSSNVSAVGVNRDDLMIRFHNGSVYRYFGLAEKFDDILKALSKGKWVWRHLRRKKVDYMKDGSLPLPDDINEPDSEMFEKIDKQQRERQAAFVGGIESSLLIPTEWGEMNVDIIGGVEIFNLL